jgi:DNA-binding beta-propeller fold protein YncE
MEHIIHINRKILIDLVVLPTILFVTYIFVSPISFKTIEMIAFGQVNQTVGPKEQYVFERSWGSEGILNDQFKVPHSLAVDIFGNVYVTDTGNNRVEKFSSNGTFLKKWGSQGLGDGQFNQLHDIAVDPKGNFVYTVELGNHRVQKFFNNGTFITKWGFNDAGGSGANRKPHQLAVDHSGDVFLTDRAGSEVLRFNDVGKFLEMGH